MSSSNNQSISDVLVLLGGPSLEHDVSVVSGSGMIRQIPSQYKNVYPVYIDRDGKWFWDRQGLGAQSRAEFELETFLDTCEFKSQDLPNSISLPGVHGQRFALLGLHGAFGEDGRVQAYLELLGIPYSGSGVLGSALAMDKIKAKEIYKHHGIPTPGWKVIEAETWESDLTLAVQEFAFPMIIKDPAGGSSYNIIRAEGESEAKEFVMRVCVKGAVKTLLAEQCIIGRECSCGFMEGAPTFPPTEIRPHNENGFFDFEAKYQGKSIEITPAEYSEQWITEIQSFSKKAHEVLQLGVYSRTDFLTDEDGQHWALETNTLPGFTPTSLLPQQADYVGWDYSELIHQVIQTSLKSQDYETHH